MNSSVEHGTLYQIRNIINYTNVGKIPKHCFNLCDDFLETVITGHILCASLKVFGMATLDDQPHDDLITSHETVDDRESLLMSLSKRVVDKFICQSFNSPLNRQNKFRFVNTSGVKGGNI